MGETAVGEAAVEFLFQVEIDGAVMIAGQPIGGEVGPFVRVGFEFKGNQAVGNALIPQCGLDLQGTLVAVDAGADEGFYEAFVGKQVFFLQGFQQLLDERIDALPLWPLLVQPPVQFTPCVLRTTLSCCHRFR